MRKTAWSNYRIYFICALHQTVNVQVLASTSPLTRWISSSISAWRRTGFSLISWSSSRWSLGKLLWGGSFCKDVKNLCWALSIALETESPQPLGPENGGLQRWSMHGTVKKQWLPHWFHTFMLNCTNTRLSSTPDKGRFTVTFLVWR